MSKEIGDRVLSVRTKTGLSQRDFAAQMGISSGGISQIESGKTMPGGEFLLRINEKFGVDITWLLTGQPASSLTPTPPLCAVPSTHPPPSDEAQLLADYRTTDEQGRAIIRAAASTAAHAVHAGKPARRGRRAA